VTIRSNIPVGAILWKFKETRQINQWDYQRNTYEMREHTDYYVIKLITRRARTRGHRIKPELKPFFDTLRIKMIPNEFYHYDNSGSTLRTEYTAVGTELQRIRNEQQWNALEINEEAKRWYTQLKNQTLSNLLEKNDSAFGNPAEIIEEMKELSVDDESEVESWPDEPRMQEYQLDISRHYYRGPVTWR
jgi:hypothetical protein